MISSQRKAGSKVHWVVQDFGAKRRSGLLVGVTPRTLHCTWHVPCVLVQEMFVSARGTSSLRRLSHRRRPRLSRVSHQNCGDVRKGDKEQENLDVQGSMEPPHRRRTYLRKGRGIEGRISRFLH
jgi:hypothetical protein